MSLSFTRDLVPLTSEPPPDALLAVPAADRWAEPDALDERFVFDFQTYDDPDDDQRWTTWFSVEPLCRGPEPRPDWVVTSQAALDTELGVLKTGKEADVFLVERAVPDDPTQSVVMAAKRYRTEEHRSFHRSSSYTEAAAPGTPGTPGRWPRRPRTAAGSPRASGPGRSGRRSSASGRRASRSPTRADRRHRDPHGARLGRRGCAAARADPPARRPARSTSSSCVGPWPSWPGTGGGDLSPYNILAAGERLVIIDLPQAVDIVANPTGMDFLMRDCVQRLHLVPRARPRPGGPPTARALRRAPRLRLLARGSLVRPLRGVSLHSDPSVPRVVSCVPDRRPATREVSPWKSSTASSRPARRRCGTGGCSRSTSASAACSEARRARSAAARLPAGPGHRGAPAPARCAAVPAGAACRSTPTAQPSTPRRALRRPGGRLRRHARRRRTPGRAAAPTWPTSSRRRCTTTRSTTPSRSSPRPAGWSG